MTDNSTSDIWDNFRTSLYESIVEVSFIKKNGTERIMKCTLVKDYYKNYEFVTESDDQHLTEINNTFQRVWDIENDGWRIIRKDAFLYFWISE